MRLSTGHVSTAGAKLRDAVAELARVLREWLGRTGSRKQPIADRAALREFLATRSSYVAQTSLYGYLRTRAGQRFPELFSNDAFVGSINIAKWNVWLACVADLAVYAGGMIARRTGAGDAEVAALMAPVVDELLAATGVPTEAGPEFAELAERVRARIGACDWTRIEDDESAFTESPGALVRWAPIIEELKALDEGIVRNSVRFRWHEVRRDLRRNLDAAAVLAGGGA